MKYFCFLLVMVALAACGTAPSGSGTGGTGGTGVGGSLPPATVTVTKSIVGSIAADGSVVVTAAVVDSNGQNVADGTNVDFTTDLAGTSITASVLTVAGRASATFNANNVAGTATVTAAAGSVSGFTTINILPSTPASITVAGVIPSQIGVKGGGLTENAIVTFDVADGFGNPVTDGTTINFSIGTPLGGGEFISPASQTTVSGQVSVTVTSGNHAGLLGVVATELGTGVATTASVPILGGPGVANNFSISTAKMVFEGYDLAANTNTFTIVLGDIFGNPVKTGTVVSFQTELGTISSTATNSAGVGTSDYTTLGADPGELTRGPNLDGKVGYLTMLAMAPGREPFVDNNNNGIFDAGDTFTPSLHDYGEPFLDANENTLFDAGEFFFDSNGDLNYTGPNGVHDDVTTIWASMVVVLSTLDFSVGVNGGGPCLDDLGPLGGFNLITIKDGNCNPVDSDGTYSASVDVGNVTGTISSGLPFFSGFTVASPTVPIAIPVFISSTHTGKDDVLAALEITASTPNKNITVGGL